ncbi:transposase [Paenibacillus larvae]|nr:transposase [Paenibacillus larvae]
MLGFLSLKQAGVSFQLSKGRGLRGVDLITSDDHGGLVRAMQQQLQGVTWQRCQTHFTRNVLEASPKALKDEIHGRLRSILDTLILERQGF